MLPASIQRNREHPVSVVFGVNDHSGVRPGFGSAAQDVSDPGGHVTFYSAGRITETGCSQTPLQEWYHYDGIGNVASITDSSGNLMTGYDQEAFGTVYGIYDGTYSYQYGGKNGISVPGIQQKGEHLTTKNYYASAQMYFFNFRWYDPVIGRFIQQEPLGLDGPNQYHFCFNNPVNGFDPNGLDYTSQLLYAAGHYDGLSGGNSGSGSSTQIPVGPQTMTVIEVRVSRAWNTRIANHVYLYWPAGIEGDERYSGNTWSFGGDCWGLFPVNSPRHGRYFTGESYQIECTVNEAEEIFAFCDDNANNGIYQAGPVGPLMAFGPIGMTLGTIFWNDCHNAVDDALNYRGYEYPPGITRINYEVIPSMDYDNIWYFYP